MRERRDGCTNGKLRGKNILSYIPRKHMVILCILFVSFVFYIILCKISAGRNFGRSKSKLKGDIPKYIKQY